MMLEKENCLDEIHSKYYPPVGTFTHAAGVVVKILLQSADNNPTLALHRLLFYMNRAGKDLENRDQLELAKSKLEELIKKSKH